MKQEKIFSAVLLFAALLGFNFGALSGLRAQAQFLPANYEEPYRGQFHFSQQSGLKRIW